MRRLKAQVVKKIAFGRSKMALQEKSRLIWYEALQILLRKGIPDIQSCKECELVHAVFFPDSTAPAKILEGIYLITASTVISCLS